MSKRSLFLVWSLLIALLPACGGGSDSPIPADTSICLNTADDSQFNGGAAIRINSKDHGSPIYHYISSVRKNAAGVNIAIDYMVHPAIEPAKALLVLIAGGQLNTQIEGTEGLAVTKASGNFLVRSAHLFARQGYKVITIDRPNDFITDTGGSSSGFAYDGYRTSVRHAVDISTIIDAENSVANLPVLFAGTSRGAISAVAQHELGSAISLSSPVTSGSGTPVSEGSLLSILHPSLVAVPAHVIWHIGDGCGVSEPAASSGLVTDFNPDAARNPIAGGFDDPAKINDCKGNTLHGFFGIESCAVGHSTNWLDGLALPVTRPTALSVTTTAVWTEINLSSYTSPAVGGVLTYSLPFTQTSLGGTVSLVGTVVTYTPPVGISGTTDSFVYVVNEAGGGISHNVIRQTIP